MRVVKMEKEHRALLIAQVQVYLHEELDCDIGNLAAESLLDFVLKQAGAVVYNQAITDAHKVLSQQMERAEEELYALEQPMEFFRRD